MESTLQLKFSDFTGQVGLFLGYGMGSANGDTAWNTQTTNIINGIVASGIRQFYFPPAPEGEGSSYDWSFLKPVALIDFPLGSKIALLPDDFGGFEGEITLSSNQSQVWWPIKLVGIGQINKEYSALPAATGRPLLACLEPLKGTSINKSQRFQLVLWPLADQDYTLQFQYYLLPDMLTGNAPYCYGGAAHAETILESCLAIAEQRLDDASSVHSMKFNERLVASISIDRKSKPQNLGRNMDRSDRRFWGRDWQHYQSRILVNGQQY